MANILSTILIIIMVSVLMRKLLSSSKQSPQINTEGKKVLRYPAVYAIVGWAGIIFTTFIAVMGYFFNIGPDKGNIIWVTFPLVFALLGIPLILLRKNTRVVFDSEKIDFTNFICKRKSIYWKDIKTIKVQRSKQIVIKDEHQKIEVNYSITGFQSLMDALKEKVNPAIFGDAQDKINKYYEQMNRR